MPSIFKPQQPFGQTNAWETQRINALQYNTSIAGSVVNLVYGTTRVGVNLIGFGNYFGPQGKKGKVGPLPITGTNPGKGGSGKGGGSGGKKGVTGKKSGNFSIDVSFGICQGPVSFPSNNKVFVSSSWTEISQSQLNFYSGTDGQAADGTMYGLGQTQGYSGTGYATGTPIDLGSSPALPNVQVETNGIYANTGSALLPGDANPGLVVPDFLSNPRYGAGFPSTNISAAAMADYGQYCQASALSISMAMDNQRQAHEWMDELAKLTNSAIVWSGSLLKFIPYGDIAVSDGTNMWSPNLTPQYSLNDDSYLPWQDHIDITGPQTNEDDPVLVTRTNPADAINWLTVEYLDKGNYYNVATLAVFDQASIDEYGLRTGENLRGHCFSSSVSAQTSAQLYLQRLLYIRNTYKWKSTWQYSLLEPMDIVLITDSNLGITNQPVRILSVEEDERGDLTFEAEEITIGTPSQQSAPFALDLSANGNIILQKDYPIPPTGPPQTALNSGTMTLSTNNAGDIIYVFASAENSGIGTPNISSITSTSGLNFTRRFQHQESNFASFNSNGFTGLMNIDVETWWAYAPNQLNNEIITVSYDGAVESAVFYSVGVNGANPTSPFDPNGGLPYSAKNNSQTTTLTEVTGVTTTNNVGIVLAFFVNYNNPVINESTPPAPPAFEWIEPAINVEILDSGSNLLGSWNHANAAAELTAAPLSSATVLCGNTYTVASWFGIVDCITAAVQ